MTHKPGTTSEIGIDDEDLRLARGKIDQYKLLESLYRKANETVNSLREELDSLKGKSDTKKDSGEVPLQSVAMRRSLSITQQLLDEASTTKLKHPTEFFQLMEREKEEEIEDLRKKAYDSQKDLKFVHQGRDELQRQINQLRCAMTEKDWLMKTLEQKFHETLSDEEKRSCLERRQILRKLELANQPPSASSLERMEQEINVRKEVEEDPESAAVRRKIDELLHRIAELQNHNEKWNALCQELQEELDRVKDQLQQYHKTEGFVRAELLADLKIQKEERVKAEQLSLLAKKRVEELEAKVIQLEEQLVEKNRLDKAKIKSMVAEEVQEKTFLYEEQIRSFKEDFENEQRDHNITRQQFNSLKIQWTTIYKELQNKNDQLLEMVPRMEAKENENRKLLEQLEQAHQDVLLIRDHHLQRTCTSNRQAKTTAAAEAQSEENFQIFQWHCPICTYLNPGTAIVCSMCSTSRKNGQRTAEPAKCQLYERGRAIKPPPGIGQLEEDGIVCF